MLAGEPVKPWHSSTPTSPPSWRNGSSAAIRDAGIIRPYSQIIGPETEPWLRARRSRRTGPLRVRLSNSRNNVEFPEQRGQGAPTLLYYLCKYVLIGPVLRLFFPA